MAGYWDDLAKQNAGFGTSGTDLLKGSLEQPTGLASFSNTMNASSKPSWETSTAAFGADQGFNPEAGGWASMLADQDRAFGAYGTDLTAQALLGTANEPGGGNWWDKTKDLVGNESFMKGALGVGQLGLGLASYLQQKPLYEEQLKGLKQNRQFAAADQQRRDTTSANFDKALG